MSSPPAWDLFYPGIAIAKFLRTEPPHFLLVSFASKFPRAWSIFLWNVTGELWFFLYGVLTQYRKFAEECRRYAQSAETDEQRNVLLEMEAAWATLAEEAEELETKSRTS